MLKTWETNREFFKFSARPYDRWFILSPGKNVFAVLLLSSSASPLFHRTFYSFIFSVHFYLF